MGTARSRIAFATEEPEMRFRTHRHAALLAVPLAMWTASCNATRDPVPLVVPDAANGAGAGDTGSGAGDTGAGDTGAGAGSVGGSGTGSSNAGGSGQGASGEGAAGGAGGASSSSSGSSSGGGQGGASSSSGGAGGTGSSSSSSGSAGGGGEGGSGSSSGGAGGASSSSSSSSSSSTSSSSSSSSSGSSGGGGGTTSGGPVDIVGDSCNAPAVVTLKPGNSVAIHGSTMGMADDFTSFCGDTDPAADTVDVVYQLRLEGAGLLKLSLDDHTGVDDFDAAMVVRVSECGADWGGDMCVDQSQSGEKAALDVAGSSFVWVVVDGVNGGRGEFTLAVDLSAPVCGDGIVNDVSAGEQCDELPLDPNICYPPGHPQQCQFKPPAVLDLESCPGQDVVIGGGEALVLGPNDTSNYADDAAGSCVGGNLGGRDHVYHFEPQADGTLSLRVGNDVATGAPFCDQCDENGCPAGCWIPVVYVRQGDCDAALGTEVACAFDDSFSTTVASVQVPVTAFQSYWVFVDSYWDGDYTAGPYYLEATLMQ